MEFENDLFLSYAHIDNHTLTEEEQGWISNLHRVLEVRLAQLLGKEPKIWRDPKLQGNDFFADELVERLPKVALLVSILSPRYVRSDWCTRELREFWKASERTGGTRIDNKARVFKVVKTPVPFEEHPAEVRDLLGYEFFTVDPGSGRPRELSQLSGPEQKLLYWAKVDDLAHDITELLKVLGSAEKGDGDGGAEAAAGEGKECIYLAETSFDLKRQRDVVKREIERQDFVVLPDRRLPLVGSECEALVREQLARCRLSIHLMGHNYGLVPEGITESIVELQNDLARQRGSQGGFGRLIWMPSDLNPEDDRQRGLIDRLRSDASLEQGMDLLEVPFEDFESELAPWLHPPQESAEERREPESGAEDELVRIYLICDQRDGEATLALEDYLFDQGFEVLPSLFDGDEAQVRQNHEESLCVCDAILLYYGAANELWLRRKLREVQRSAGLGRDKPMLAQAIYVAPPEDPRKGRLRTREAMVIRQGASLEPALEPFLREIRSEKARRS